MNVWKRARVLGFGGALLLSSACGSGPLDVLPDSETPPGLGFHVADTLFGPGDMIRVDLSNNTEFDLLYNLCADADLERWVAGRRWLSVQKLPENAGCIGSLALLRSGESTFGAQVVYPFIDSGVYRFRARVEWPLGDEQVELISNAFRIVR